MRWSQLGTWPLVFLMVVACGEPGQDRSDAAQPPNAGSTPGGPPSASPGAEWEQTLERVVPCVVVLRVRTPRTFDTYSAGNSVGTGFVVDAEQGLILTNRHLVKPGPVVAEAVFENHEEIEIEAVYRDPVHDFGLYRFDPADVEFMSDSLCALKLAPEEARVGIEIRVVGNDAGEKLSILSGTLARLDRPAPHYGSNNYNDFNTFYYQAASGTSGGSSGSPVINVKGHVVALNAGGSRRAASSYYLPLDRVVRALDLLRGGEPVPRGTLQTVFRREPFDEVSRLGLRKVSEQAVRSAFPEQDGMLVVREVLPKGPADGKLEPGDVLVRLDGELVTTFLPIEARLDGRVGQTVKMEVERGGEPVTVELTVDDLHALIPSEYIEVGGAVIHPLSYHQARNHNLPVQGLYVANTGYMLNAAGVPSKTLLLEVNGEAVDSLDALWTVLSARSDHERLRVRYARVSNARHDRVQVAYMDRSWFPMQRCRREGGAWPCQSAAPPPNTTTPEPRTSLLPAPEDEPARALSASLVMVDFSIPYRIEGVWGSNFRGAGLVVDAERGLVVTDRDTVPNALGDASIIVGGKHRIPAQVVFIHPVHNVAVVRYDPALVGDTPLRSARLTPRRLEPGETVWQVSLTRRSTVVSRESVVERITPLTLPYDRNRPSFRESSVEVIELEDATRSLGGVLANARGDVLAMWSSFHVEREDDSSFFTGLPIEHVKMITEPLSAGQSAIFRTLGAELSTVTLSQASELDLPEAWSTRLAQLDPSWQQVLSIHQIARGFPADGLLRNGDLLLAVDGQPMVHAIDFERATQAESVKLTVLREGEELDMELSPRALDGMGTERVVVWAGATLHTPHLEVATQRGLERRGLYVAWIWHGSPAAKFRLRPTRRILEVNGVETPDMDAFLAAVAALETEDSVRLLTVDLDEQRHMITLRPDVHFWPTREFVRGSSGW